ncbi:Gfo/Idh/MocA family protein [Oceanicoccus sp. KOV_DT_Chl]|uniref:Gfo/Idh/MocA family protein n=1 Tax=Oceanicoccus sp. KOV_DT_Chl TaxID=1904639 RepID=UPI000C798C66|nr:Gfo/Idh/MocA family oxidoreductase [Oceanicoccus sp. KOV_DT_Chl]
MKEVRVGLIGTGYMGKAHAIALRAMPAVFPVDARVICELLADPVAQRAEKYCREFCFNRWTDDWQALVADEAVDVVDICAPNFLHYDMAMAAIAQGKHVYCEKPLSLSAEQSLEMTEAAEAAGVKTLVGYNYAKNPATALAKEIIESGEIGEVIHFRGTHIEDYLADPSIPYSWRLQRKMAGLGALGDLCHIINMAQLLVGGIEQVCADMQTVIKRRPIVGSDDMGEVENEDQAHMMMRFTAGAIGTIECSRVAHGRKLGLTYEVTGTKGSLVFDQERQNELQFYSAADASNRQGFRTILVGPEHPDYAAFCCAPGHGLGFNDQKIIEVRDLIEGIVNERAIWPDFRAALAVDNVNAAAERSFLEQRWVNV